MDTYYLTYCEVSSKTFASENKKNKNKLKCFQVAIHLSVILDLRKKYDNNY